MEPVPFAEIFNSFSFKLDNITLDQANLVDVIMPSGVRASASSASYISKLQSEQKILYKSFRNGAVVVYSDSASPTSSFIQEKEIVNAGTVSLNMEVDLAELLGNGTRGTFVIQGQMDNIRITDNTEFALPDGLKNLDLRLDSDLEFDVNFSGDVSVNFGPFSDAWKEVEQIEAEILKQKAVLKGLSTDHKQGKFPLAGLVWSVPCPNTCPVTTERDSIGQAKALGVIVWIYLNVQGDFGINGDVSIARLEPSKLSLAIKKSPGGKLQFAKSLLAKDPSGRLLVAPSIDGDVTFGLTAGITTDVDFFAGGLYLANAGIDLAVQTNMAVNGSFNYGTNSLEGPWNWQGEACFQFDGAAGAIVRAATAFGVQIDSTWDRLDVDKYYTYGFQIPTDEQIANKEQAGAWFPIVDTEICPGLVNIIYSEDFTSDPNFTSLAPAYAYWNSTGGYYFVNTRDDSNNKYWAYSPDMGLIDTSLPTTIEFDVMFEYQDWGTYPGVRFYAQPPTEIDAADNLSVLTIHNAYSDSAYKKISISDRTNPSLQTPTISDDTWYHIYIHLNGDATANIQVTNNATSTIIYSIDNTPFEPANFRYLGVGYYNIPNYGDSWSPIRLDNIVIAQ